MTAITLPTITRELSVISEASPYVLTVDESQSVQSFPLARGSAEGVAVAALGRERAQILQLVSYSYLHSPNSRLTVINMTMMSDDLLDDGWSSNWSGLGRRRWWHVWLRRRGPLVTSDNDLVFVPPIVFIVPDDYVLFIAGPSRSLSWPVPLSNNKLVVSVPSFS